MKQCSEEWFEARRGKLTASRLHRLMSDNLQTNQRLLDDLRLEIEAGPGGWMEGRFLETPATTWGKKYERKAISLYTKRFGIKVCATGILFHPQLDYVGASPDGMIDGGSVEVKCPYTHSVHEKTLRNGMPRKHYCQVQTQSFVTGLPFVDFISYHPAFKKDARLFVQRIPADAEYHRKLHARCEWLWSVLQNGGKLC